MLGIALLISSRYNIFSEGIPFLLQGALEYWRLIQVVVWFTIIFWVLVSSCPITKDTEKEKTRLETIKQRLTQNIDNDNPYLGIKSIVPGQQPNSVLFEPMIHIRLSQSTYKVTSFIEFTPYIQSFINFEVYLNKFVEDIQDPTRVSGFVYLLNQHKHTVLSSVDIRQFSRFIQDHSCGRGRNNPAKVCKYNPIKGGWDRHACIRQYDMVCRTKSQFKAVADTALYINQSFNQIKEEFLSVIDHLETEEDEPQARKSREHNERVRQELKISYTRVSTEELQTLNKVVDRVEESYPNIKTKLKRVKRFGVMSWVLGWGVYSNYKQIETLKENVQTLYEQNLLQEQQIQDLAQYLNLTATRVQLHDKMLYNIQVRLNQVNFSIAALQDIVQYTIYSNNMLFDANIVSNRLITGLIVLRNNVEQIYKYLRVIASQKVDPIMIPPPPLRELLAEAEREMAHNPRLELPYSIGADIYKYYTVMKITPVVVGDVMAMLLTIPLIDKSLKMNVYKVHNLPALDPELKVASEYILESEYLAIDKHGLYVALPDTREIQICLTSQGGLCMMNQVLHPIETINWCIYALFIQDQERIKKDCTMSFKPREGNLAQSLGGYLWAISSLVGEKMQIRYLQETHIKQIRPPLQVIHVGNGCEGYSPSIKIPAKNELTSQNDIIERTNYFLEFNMQYTKVTKIGPWDLFEISDWEKQELADMVTILLTLPPLNYENLNKRIRKLKEYPLKIPVAIIAIVLVVSTLFMVTTIIIIALVIYRLRGNIKNLTPIVKIMIGKANPNEINQVRQTLRTLLDLTPGLQHPPELPERRKALELTPETSKIQQKSILPASTDIKRYEQYLNHRKEEMKKGKQ